jgi:N-acetylglutamate synthase-like GNAT family acetyltransferase
MDTSYQGMYLPQTIEGLKVYHNQENIVADHAKGALIVVVEIDDQVVATGTCMGTYVKRVFVHPSYHRRSLGAMVMDVIETHVSNSGLGFVELFATLPSEEFYLKRGYTTIDLYHNPQLPGQVEYFRMLKPLVACRSFVPVSDCQWRVERCDPALSLGTMWGPFRFLQAGGIVYSLLVTTTEHFAEIIGLFLDENTILMSSHHVEFNKNWKSYHVLLSLSRDDQGCYRLSAADGFLELVQVL